MNKFTLLLLLLAAGCLPLAGQGKKLDLSKVKCTFTAHVNGKNAPLPQGSEMKVTAKGIEMAYVFPSKGHDACMATFPVQAGPFQKIKVEFTVDAPGHRPFLVLMDKNNEKHYFSIPNNSLFSAQLIRRKGRQAITCVITAKNKFPGEKYAYRWGGDDNQKIDFPVKSVMLGLNDSPDTFTGKGKITFHSITFQ